MKRDSVLRASAVGVVGVMLMACVSGCAAEGQRTSGESGESSPEERKPLGVLWGESRSSSIETTPFVRADKTDPFQVDAIYTTSEAGAQGMSVEAGFKRTASGLAPVGTSEVLVGLKSEQGQFLAGFRMPYRRFVVQETGARFSIVVRNGTDARIECVISVDGLDVIDGKEASFSKRGYIVDARGEIEVDGFRTDASSVAAFRAGSTPGVIGIALFREEKQ